MKGTFMNKPTNRFTWRPRDIVLASIVGVACGGLFALWNIASVPVLQPLGALLPGFQALGHGVWLIGGVLTALVVRRPGAALYGELLAATVSALIGNQWGVITLFYGAVQGLAAELVFAFFAYRMWGWIVAIIAGGVAGVAMAGLDLILFYPAAGATFFAIYGVSSVVSGVVLAGLGSVALHRGLVRAGALRA
ncbi:MAG: energy-coupling factor transport system substrate-specific component [Pontimonas sp.]|jgi:energy-coupling factor transport system substrate-specific component